MKRNIILALSASIVLASCVVSKKKLTSTVLAKNNGNNMLISKNRNLICRLLYFKVKMAENLYFLAWVSL